MKIARATAELYAEWFACLAEPTRIEILNMLAGEARPLSVGQIVERTKLSQSTVSEHLRRLAESRFVHVDYRGTSSYYRFNERCTDCFPSAARLVMGKSATQPSPAPVARTWRRSRRGRVHRGAVARSRPR